MTHLKDKFNEVIKRINDNEMVDYYLLEDVLLEMHDYINELEDLPNFQAELYEEANKLGHTKDQPLWEVLKESFSGMQLGHMKMDIDPADFVDAREDVASVEEVASGR